MNRLVLVSQDATLQQRVYDALQVGADAIVTILESLPEPVSPDALQADVMLVDVRADHDTPQRLRSLLATAVARDVPVIVLVPATSPEALRYLDMGANDLLSLDVRITELKTRIKVQLRLKRRLDQLSEDAVVDQTTGVYNRRYMESHLLAQLAEAWRYHYPFSFAILDIDYFKLINDRHGHRFGDAVLRQLGRLIRGQVRLEDTLTRYGGEEFALLLPHTDRSGAWMLGERIRTAVADHVFCQDHTEARITVSIGVATYPADAPESAEELVRRADRRLYQAKHRGRNRVVHT